MQVPKGNPIHENLNTSYVNLAALLAELQLNKFTGYVLLNFENYEGCTFLDKGQVLNAYEQQTGLIIKRGSDAIESMISRAQARGGAVSFFEHPESVVRAIAGIIDGEPVYIELAAEFTHLERLIDKLKKSPESVWYIEVALGQSAGGGIIYVVDGTAEAVISTHEIPAKSILKTTVGEEGLNLTIDCVNAYGGIFNVYRTKNTKLSEINNFEIQNSNNIEDPTLVDLVSDLQSNNLENTSSDEVLELDLLNEPNEQIDLTSEQIDITEEFHSEEVPLEPEPEKFIEPSANNGTEEIASISLTDEQYSELINLMGEIIAAVERGIADIASEKDFKVAFRRSLIQAAEHYPFLDPFAAEFEYSSGEVVFTGSDVARPADFVVGISQALKWTVADLSQSILDPNLRMRVETTLSNLQRNRRADFEKFGLEIALEEIIDN